MEIPQELINRFKVFNIDIDNKKIVEILSKEVDSLETPPTFYQLLFWDDSYEESKKQIFSSLREAEDVMNELLDGRYSTSFCVLSKHVGFEDETIATKRGTEGNPLGRPDTPDY